MQGKSGLWVVVGDIHSHMDNFARIPELKQADGVIISGDLTNMGGVAQAEAVLNVIGGAGLPVLAQIGNMDKGEVSDWLSKSGINLHCQVHELGSETAIFGVGGSTATPFATPSEFSEEMYADWLNELWARAKKYPHTILVSHNPPANTLCDDIGGGAHVGSTSVRRFIERNQPELCVCGHIHEGRAVDHIDRTKILNPGQLGDGGYVVIRLDNGELSAELKQVNF